MSKYHFNLVVLYILTLVVLSLFSACKSPQNNSLTPTQRREIVDDLGRKVSLPTEIKRAVSLAPNLTENIFAIGEGDKLVGVTTYCNFPAEASQIKKVGDTINPNIETIIALKPDVVFVSTASQIESFTKQLAEQNIAVYVTNPNSLTDVFANLRKLGELFGTSEKADKLVADLEKRTNEIEQKVKDKKSVKVFVQISKEPLFTVGGKSFLTDLIKRAGGESVTADVAEAYPKFSKETALALQPDVIILSESEDNKEPNDVFKNSPAVKNSKVFKINADIISRPSPRLVDALEQIAEKIH